MFVSFFPRPLIFTLSAILWAAFTIGLWYTYGHQLGELLGFNFQTSGEKIVGAAVFWSSPFLWFYLYFVMAVGLFASAWMVLSPHPWSRWSIFGSALILFTSYFQVQVSVAINSWYGPFYDLVQAALSKSAPVTLAQFYVQLATFAEIAFVAVTVGVLDQIFCQPLHLPLAHCDERLLRRALAATADRRGSITACARRCDAVCDVDGGTRGQSRRCGHDADCISAGAGQPVEQR